MVQLQLKVMREGEVSFTFSDVTGDGRESGDKG